MGERGASDPVQPVKETLAYADRAPRKPPAALDVTLAAPPAANVTAPAPSGYPATVVPSPSLANNVRSTVLPRIERREGMRRVVVEGKPRYEALRALGEGGQAEVTLVRDHDIDRSVAVKRLRPELNDDDSVLRFAEEIRTVGQLEHPNIVPIHDVGVDEEGHYFFVMKYVEGETIESIIAGLREKDPEYEARYPMSTRVSICIELLRGVQHAHEMGILHRDLKPGNVMVGSLGEVVVMDWGLAKRMSEASEDLPSSLPPLALPSAKSVPASESERARLFETQAGALLGTPAYMSPEQAAGRPIDARSDVYSLAVLFYEFLSLRHPRAQHESVAAMIASVVSEPITKGHVISEFAAAKVPVGLAHFVKHGIAHEPGMRYQTIAEMRGRLEDVRDGKAPIECPVTFTDAMIQNTSRAVNRHPYVTVTAVALAGLSALAGIGFTLFHFLAR